jgi:hypothetical protein
MMSSVAVKKCAENQANQGKRDAGPESSSMPVENPKSHEPGDQSKQEVAQESISVGSPRRVSIPLIQINVPTFRTHR